MSKAVFYAMDAEYLQSYIDHKNQIDAIQSGGKVSLEMIEKVKAQIDTYRGERVLYSVDNDGTAHINVAGPLEPKPDPCAVMFDIEMTTYSDIIEATRSAEGDPNTKKIMYHFNTPGGNVVGLFRAADVIKGAVKPTHGIIHSLCASAGYALASQCDILEAENISGEQGSIGVVTEYVDRSKMENGMGITRYIITSDNAENKRADPATNEGYLKIKARITELEGVFVEYVANGRKVSKEKVLSDFGRGGIKIAREALRVGMIDGIINDIGKGAVSEKNQTLKNTELLESTDPNATGQNKNEKENSMDEKNVTMTKDELAALMTDTANKTAANVRAELSASSEKIEADRKAEETRIAGFKPLYAKYPEQKTMIDSEVEKKGYASAAFAITLADAEAARVAALEEQTNAAGNTVDPTKQKGQKTDTSGDDFLASMGVNAEKLKGEI